MQLAHIVTAVIISYLASTRSNNGGVHKTASVTLYDLHHTSPTDNGLTYNRIHQEEGQCYHRGSTYRLKEVRNIFLLYLLGRIFESYKQGIAR